MEKNDLRPEDARLREQLQHAVRTTPVPIGLETRIRAAIRGSERPRFVFGRFALAATLAAGTFGGVIAYQLGHLRLTTGSQEAYIDSVSNDVASIMRVGLRDHIHCAVYRKYPKNAPGIEELAGKMSPGYRPLIEIARKHVPREYRLMISHECRHRGRKFVHLTFKSDSRLVSLILARKEAGEAFATEQLLPALTHSGIPMYRAAARRFEIAAFESGGHLAYVVSDLPKNSNMELMLALSADVKAFLSSLEG